MAASYSSPSLSNPLERRGESPGPDPCHAVVPVGDRPSAAPRILSICRLDMVPAVWVS
jgi:hypothetical protein